MDSCERIAWSLAALLIVASVAVAEEIDKDFHKSFDVHPGQRLVLRHGDGDVSVTPWNSDVLDVQVRYRVTTRKIGWGSDADLTVEFTRDGDAIRVIGKEKSVVAIGFAALTRREYTYTVQAPDYLALDLVGDDGDVHIKHWTGPIRCKNEDGDVDLADITALRTEIDLEDGELHIERLEGELRITGEDGGITVSDCHCETCRIRSEDGDVTIESGEGDFEVQTEDGDVDLRRILAHALDVETSDGNVNLQLRRCDDLDAEIVSEDGDIEVELSPATPVTFLLESDGQDIHLELPGAEILHEDHRSIEGKLTSGRGRLRIRTDDGGIRLRQGPR